MMFVAERSYFVIFEGTVWGIVSGAAAAEMVARGSEAIFQLA